MATNKSSMYEDSFVIDDGATNSSKKLGARSLTTYYQKLKNFNYYSGPKEISDKLAEIKKNLKTIKSRMEELNGSTIMYQSDIVDGLDLVVDDVKNYVDDALDPATKQIESLKSDLEQYYQKYRNSKIEDEIVYDNYTYNDSFNNYLSTEGRRLSSIERRIYQKISDIQSLSNYNFRYSSSLYGTTIYPYEYTLAIPTSPIEVTPKYGVELPTSEIFAYPDYGVQLPTELIATPKYGVELPTSEIFAYPDYGVQLPTEIEATPKYGVELPTTPIVATPKYGVELPTTPIVATPKYGVELPTSEIFAYPDYGVQLPTSELYMVPDYGVQLPTSELYAYPKYGVEPVYEVYSAPSYGVEPLYEVYSAPSYGVEPVQVYSAPAYGVIPYSTR
jgi:hypothetical protein